MHKGTKILLVFTALWLTLEASTGRHTVDNVSTCSKVKWCMGYKQTGG